VAARTSASPTSAPGASRWCVVRSTRSARASTDQRSSSRPARSSRRLLYLRDVVVRFLKGYLRTIQWFYEKRDEVIPTFAS
jgi:hypothetical protein